MRSKALPPARAQGHIVSFLEAAALFAALCIFARTAALMLAAAITAPLPMAETLFWLGRQSAQEQPASSVQVEAAPDSTPEAAASSLPQAVQALTGNIEDYLVPLLGEEARPADAGAVIEKNYPQLSLIAKKSVFFYAMFLYQKLLISKHDINKSYICIQEYLKKIDFNNTEKKQLTIKEKIWVFMGKKSMYFTCKIRKLIHIGI